MIQFSLTCSEDHAFDGWFRSNEDFEAQVAKKLVSCPVCGTSKVEKALMAPAVSTSRKREKISLALNNQQRQAMKQLREMTEKVKENADYVGDQFASEARKIHFGEVDARGIYGEATKEEAKGLIDDGVSFVPLPKLPDDQN